MTLGQASGGGTESSSALRVLHAGIKNGSLNLAADGFTQTNPPIVSSNITTSLGFSALRRGVLSGSVAFTRPDAGSSFVGGPKESGLVLPVDGLGITPVGVFMNSALGNPYENQPAMASGKNTFVQSGGMYGNSLYETLLLSASAGGTVSAGAAHTYVAGGKLIASRNGYLMPSRAFSGSVWASVDNAGNAAEVANGASASTVIGDLFLAPETGSADIVYKQRI